jgi:Concanavalin A-like lectin/glucanases superfamily
LPPKGILGHQLHPFVAWNGRTPLDLRFGRDYNFDLNRVSSQNDFSTAERRPTMKMATASVVFSSVPFAAIALLIVPIRTAGGAEESKGSYKLEFSGNDSCVVIPRLRYDGSHPITLEALVTPMARDDDPPRSCVLGNVELSGLAIHYNQPAWMFHFNDGRPGNAGYASVYSKQEFRPNRQSHIAGVYDGQNVNLFIDGKLQPDSATTINPHNASIFDFMVGADPDRQGKPHQFFKGTIDEVRISKVARYHESFKPAKEKFEPDASTLVLYHFDEGEGEVAKDASDNKFNGLVQGAKWVKATD